MRAGGAGDRSESKSIQTSIARSAGSLDLLQIPRVPLSLHPGLSSRGLLRRPSPAVAEQLSFISILSLMRKRREVLPLIAGFFLSLLKSNLQLTFLTAVA